MNGGTLTVSGGSGGITASGESMTRCANTIRSAAHDNTQLAMRLHGLLATADLTTSSLVDPAGAVRFSAALADALNGPLGLAAGSATLELLGHDLLGAAAAYRRADDLAIARTYARALVRLPTALWELQSGVVASFGRLASGDPSTTPLTDGVQSALTADPQLLDVAVTLSASDPRLVALRQRFVISQLLADGKASVRRGESTHTAGIAGDANPLGAPRTTADLLRTLSKRSSGGDIDVRFLNPASANGRRAVIIDIPGTDNWRPSQGNPDVTNLGTNVSAISGHTTTYEKGIVEAMRRAGVRPDDDVMLVGHSQGGMVAVTTARDLSRSGEFHVTHVVTAGSPIGETVGQLPRGVDVLAFENSSDIVPHLDGRPNPDLPNVTTVTVDRPHTSVGDSHGLATAYVPGATDLDSEAGRFRSTDDFRAGLSPYLNADSVRTEVFHIGRAAG